MKITTRKTGLAAALLTAVMLCGSFTGCQTTIGGQTLPSPDFLSDDVAYFPHGPEFPLTKQVEAMKRYEQERLGLQRNDRN